MNRILIAAFGAFVLAAAAYGGWDEATQTFTPSDGQVVLYEGNLCKGKPFMVVQRDRTYNDFRSYYLGANSSSGNWNDKVSCIDLGPNTTLTVYQHINFAGASKTYSANRSNPGGEFSLTGDWWNNNISSCKVP